MKPLTRRQFDKLARELFGAVLSPYGFSCNESKRCTFVRQISDDVFHIILPDPGPRCTWYDVNVFPTSPKFYADFAEKFPDDLGFTLDSWSKLSESAGVGMDQQQFNCKYESNMRNRFAQTVALLLTDVAVPFLDRIQTYKDILPHLRGPFSRFKNGT
jgi:hypothetical protein